MGENTQAEKMTALREAVKKHPGVTYGGIAFHVGRTASWVGVVLRGNYPYYKANRLPRNIARALERLNFDVPEDLVL